MGLIHCASAYAARATGMRRLEHLAGVERMEVGIVVLEPAGGLVQHSRDALRARRALGRVGEGAKTLVETVQRGSQRGERFRLEHGR